MINDQHTLCHIGHASELHYNNYYILSKKNKGYKEEENHISAPEHAMDKTQNPAERA